MDYDTGGDDAPPRDRIAHDHFFDPDSDHAVLGGASRDPHDLTAERYLA